MLSAPLLDELARLGRAVRYRRGERLVRIGDRPGQVVVVHEGIVKVVAATPEGDEMIVALRGPGDLIGEFSMLSGSRSWVTVEVLEDVEASAVPGRVFLDFARANPDLLIAQVQRLVVALRQSDEKRLAQATVDLTARVARSLLELRRIRMGIDPDPRGDDRLPVSQEELAHLCGASREAVARVLRGFREAGWVRTERRAVAIDDVAALADRADVALAELELGGPIDLR